MRAWQREANILLLLLIFTASAVLYLLQTGGLEPETTLPPQAERAREIAISLCFECQNWPESTDILLERPDGIVVVAYPTNSGGGISVIDTKVRAVTDGALSPFVRVEDSLVVLRAARSLNDYARELMVLSPGSTQFVPLVGSALGADETYDTGDTFDLKPNLDASVSGGTITISVFRFAPDRIPFQRVRSITLPVPQR